MKPRHYIDDRTEVELTTAPEDGRIYATLLVDGVEAWGTGWFDTESEAVEAATEHVKDHAHG